jgi:glycosyltransferase involved in cell wall biosynthesis
VTIEKKKYWLITTEYPPAYGGGIGTYCYHNAAMLNQEGWDVTVFLSGKSGNKDIIYIDNGVRIIQFGINRSDVWNYLGYDTALAYEFAEIIREYLKKEGIPAVIESQEYAGIAYFILQYKHLNYPLFKDIKLLLTLHAPSFLYNEYNRIPAYQLPYFWIGEMERWCIKAADEVNSPSLFMTEAILAYFNHSTFKKPISIIPYPFKDDLAKCDHTTDPRMNWYFFGKLTPQKGILELLSSFRKLFNEGWDKPLHLIGGGDHFFHIEDSSVSSWIRKEYASEIKTGKIRLLGNLSPAKWKEATNKECVILIPSIGDNYPFAVIESLNNGKVVLASKQGGQAELIEHGVNGFLFDHTLKDDFQKKIKEIQEYPPEDIMKIQTNAKETVRIKHSYKEAYVHKKKILDKISFPSENKAGFPFTREIPCLINKDESEYTTGKDDLLSVIIPYYNMELYIEEALISVYASTYKNIEVIIVDDGSTHPESMEVLNLLKGKYQFKYHQQENKGLSITRNEGAKLASGKFIAFVDADDKVDKDYFSKAVSILKEKKNVSFVGSWVQYFENSKGVWPSFTPEPPYILYYNMVCSGGLVYVKKHYLNSGMNDRKLEYGLEDWDGVIGMIENGYRGVVLPEKLYHYRVRTGSMARKFNEPKLLYSIKYITEKHITLYKEYAAEVNGLLHANGQGYKINNPSIDLNKYGGFTQKYPLLRKMMNKAKKNPMIKRVAFKIYSGLKKIK